MRRLLSSIVLLMLIVSAADAQAPFYDEPYRPQYHFSPPAYWINDPNGLVFYDGEYHLFYQHHPESLVWGPMHWGHAVSGDLVHWTHLPIALYPDEIGEIWSGSVVVDAENTSGLVEGGGLVAVFSYRDQSQGIAYSTDRGRTWTKYEGNPVLAAADQDFRDPKVFWHNQTGRWVMVIAAGDRVHIYHSPNLIDWTFASEFGEGEGGHGGVWEVPDLFPLDVNGETKWVLLVSVPGAPAGGGGIQYFIGSFDGTAFANDNPPRTTLWLDYGPDHFAGTTWNNAPTGERILISWMNNWMYAQEIPTSPWRGAMTLPRVLTLRETPDGIHLTQTPISQLSQLRANHTRIRDRVLSPGMNLLPDTIAQLVEIDAEFELDTADSFGFKVRVGEDESTVVSYDTRSSSLFVNRLYSGAADFNRSFPGIYHARMEPVDNRIKMRIFVDMSSVEVFGNDGLVAITAQIFPAAESDRAEVFAAGGDVKLVSLDVYSLDSVWAK